MSDTLPVVPQGYATAAPWIIGRDTRGLMDFLGKAFGAEDLGSVENEDGTIGHAEMRVGDTILLMFDAPAHWSPTPAFIRLYIADAPAAFERALAAGAEAVTDVTHLAFGDRVGRVRDPFGNVWWVQERVETPSEDEMGRRWSDPVWGEAMAYVQSSLSALYKKQ